MAGTLSPRAERRAATRDAILAATLTLVAQRGWAAASMHDVARRAGVATGSLYRHFPSKGDLLAEVFAEAAGREQAMVAEIAADAERPPLARLAPGGRLGSPPPAAGAPRRRHRDVRAARGLRADAGLRADGRARRPGR